MKSTVYLLITRHACFVSGDVNKLDMASPVAL